MKKLLFISAVIFSTSSYGQRVPPGNDWQLSATDAAEMMQRLNECGVFKPCHNTSRVMDPDNDVYQWIVNTYGSTCTITMVDARYRDNDESRYQRLRGLPDTKSKVRGYKTLLVKVVPGKQKGAGTEIMYFDCYTICPPPSDCSSPTN